LWIWLSRVQIPSATPFFSPFLLSRSCFRAATGWTP
jgi:hypothetical protein